MYARKVKDPTVIKESKNILIPIFILAAALLILGLFPQIVLDMLEPITHQLQLIVPLP
jgi:formate hydrogenlyase subunit 3/multisubunit Na+/H+ antiporter MnhD subunit